MAAAKKPVPYKSEKPWRDALQRAVKRRSEGKGSPQALDRLADRLVATALEGDVAALKEIGDRLDGKPTQQIDHGAAQGGSVTFVMHLKDGE